MSLADVTLLVGPIGALALVPAAAVVLAWRRRPRWALWVGSFLVLTAAGGWIAYWVNWGWAFEDADAVQAVPATLEARLGYLALVTAVATVAMAATVGVSLARSRRHA